MKRALNVLISLYPQAWRSRYQGEFEALLDDVPPTWRTVFDVLGVALKMQMKTWTPWKMIAAFALAGVVGAGAYSLTIPDRYVSRAIIKVEPNTSGSRLGALSQRVLTRSSLAELIHDEDLYKGERTRVPLDDLIEEMKTRDIAIEAVNTVNGLSAFSVSVAASDATRARGAAQFLAARFVDAKAGSILDPASLPARPVGPRRSRDVIMGLMLGTLIGILFALFNGLKVWKLAVTLGIAGAMLGGATSYIFPEQYISSAVVRYEGGRGLN